MSKEVGDYTIPTTEDYTSVDVEALRELVEALQTLIATDLTAAEVLAAANTVKADANALKLVSATVEYADNAAAVTGGLAVGALYRITSTDHVGVVHA